MKEKMQPDFFQLERRVFEMPCQARDTAKDARSKSNGQRHPYSICLSRKKQQENSSV